MQIVYVSTPILWTRFYENVVSRRECFHRVLFSMLFDSAATVRRLLLFKKTCAYSKKGDVLERTKVLNVCGFRIGFVAICELRIKMNEVDPSDISSHSIENLGSVTAIAIVF